MIKAVLAAVVVAALSTTLFAAGEGRPRAGSSGEPGLYGEIAAYIAERQAEFDQISEERKAKLDELAYFVRQENATGKPAQLVFVCTHNSRRSHMSQLWAAAAAEAYGLQVTTYSGGTETTAFNPRAVAAMERAGWRVEKTTAGDNPVYHARFSDRRPSLTCFSKRYDAAPNPKNGFAAIMVCGDADRSCPLVLGSSGRFALPFVDPKISDGTPAEPKTYDERCAQIAREMLYVMSRAAD